jgi:DivIVA domain-containing protein
MMLTPTVVRYTQFTMTRLRPGYQPRAVDAFLDRLAAGLDRLIRENEEIRAGSTAIRPPSGATVDPGPMTPADVRNAYFTLTLPGYEPMEVDDYLDRLEDELDRLIRENATIPARLAGTRHGRSGLPVS